MLRTWSPTQKLALLIVIGGIGLSGFLVDPLYFTTMLVPVAGMVANREYQKRKKGASNETGTENS